MKNVQDTAKDLAVCINIELCVSVRLLAGAPTARAHSSNLAVLFVPKTSNMTLQSL